MELFSAIKKSFEQLNEVLACLSEQQYISPSENLSNATIGQHMRHIIELYQCLMSGYDAGIVCYDHRKRDIAIETNKDLAGELLAEILSSVNRQNKELQLESWHGDADPSMISLHTNYYRELMYNLEHSVHHMALIRVGLKELSTEPVSENFGIASSTIRYKQQCAQ
ncbi:MAG: DinB family protein [Chitinophagaceae bacterium]|nr:DinB family protein [Chitinophagaceae bacterium]